MRLPRAFTGLLLALLAPAAASAPRAVPTFESIGLYWTARGGDERNAAQVAFREAGSAHWRAGLGLWFDPRNREYRGSLVELAPGTRYEVRLTLESGLTETIRVTTWSEKFPVKEIVRIPAGSTRLVIELSQSGNERQGYVVFTGAPGENVIDQESLVEGRRREACVVVKQGVHHVIIRGLNLRNCKRYGVLLERESGRELDAQTHDIVIEDNVVSGWGGFERAKPGSGLADNDGAIHCDYARETDDSRRPQRITIQRNTLRDPRHGSNPWQSAGVRRHPQGPQGVLFNHCGSNHVLRYNRLHSANGNYFMDGIGGGPNYSFSGFPWADSDIYGNWISEVYDDAIEAEGANRNVRIWANYMDRVMTAIANAATSVGPLYVWRNVSHRMAGMYQPDAHSDADPRGSFIKAGSRHPTAVGGRAYYFHNTVLQPLGRQYSLGAGSGIDRAGGPLYNLVSRNNIWHIHKEDIVAGRPKFSSIRADADRGMVDVDFDLYNGRLVNAGPNAERRGWGPGGAGRPVYASSGRSYPDLEAEPGNFSLSRRSLGYGAAERIANFNDRYSRPDVGAHQSGMPPMRFGPNAHRLHSAPMAMEAR